MFTPFLPFFFSLFSFFLFCWGLGNGEGSTITTNHTMLHLRADVSLVGPVQLSPAGLQQTAALAACAPRFEPALLSPWVSQPLPPDSGLDLSAIPMSSIGGSPRSSAGSFDDYCINASALAEWEALEVRMRNGTRFLVLSPLLIHVLSLSSPFSFLSPPSWVGAGDDPDESG
jgi:hypothetical protein